MKIGLILFMSVFSINLLANGNVAKGKAKSAVCVACHGATGNSSSTAYPKLAGQGEAYLLKQLRDFKSQTRKNGTMFGMVASLSDTDMQNLAAFFSSQKITPNVAKKDKKMLELGERIYRGGKLDTNTTACIACHGVRGKGIPSAKFPALAFQHADYIDSQLKNFRQASFDAQENKTSSNTRTNDPAKMMRNIAKSLTNKEIKALAEYIAGLH
ncbi:Cytochrome c4 [hydrothermal vent metagenome]|uniref:Cytochrome c4 n=1 Tax=hydrothermal vent metagenome TaxID=652676 RepID=A0A1W1CMC8_9ZZZZ